MLASAKLYALPPDEIRARLAQILSMRGLKLPQKHLYIRALDIYATAPFLDFEDAIAVAHMERSGIQEIYSYDRAFDRVTGVERTEP